MIFIAGPCTWDDDDQLEKDLIRLKEDVEEDKFNQFYFKSSWLKDNRSYTDGYRGPGINGITTLIYLKEKHNIKLCTDFHNVEEINKYGSMFDIIQIPAFLSKQTSLIEAASKKCNLIHIKKAQWLSFSELKGIDGKVWGVNQEAKIILTDRGTYGIKNNLYMDPRHIQEIKNVFDKNGIITGVDITHSNKGCKERGMTPFQDSMITAISYKNAGVDVVFMEVTENPQLAKCDADTMLNYQEALSIYKNIKDK